MEKDLIILNKAQYDKAKNEMTHQIFVQAGEDTFINVGECLKENIRILKRVDKLLQEVK